MTTRGAPRRVAVGVSPRTTRLAQQLRSAATPLGGPPRRPLVSIVVPIYNVEDYLRPCLDSVLGQDLEDFEVLVVDDGSPDDSARIASEYAERDPRLRVISRLNGGLGAARNTGLGHATGEYLTFVDSDDQLPPHALSAMVESARESGSDIVVGSLRRFTGAKRWKPEWVDALHDSRRTAVTLEDFPALLRNNYTWGKLYRRDFWESCGLWFRERVSYEDQPLVTRLLLAAARIDVLPEPVYLYRSREDGSSLSQQTASIADLRYRVLAWRLTHEMLVDRAPRAVYDAWLGTLFGAHFLWYLRSDGTDDPVYWQELQSAVGELTAHANTSVWDATNPEYRVAIELARQDRRNDVREFSRRDGYRIRRHPTTVADDGVQLHLPYHDDPHLDPGLFELRPEQLRLSHGVQSFRWIGGSTMRIEGWAYIRHLDLTGRESRPTLVLRNERTGSEHEFACAADAACGYGPPDEDAWVDYDGGQFAFDVAFDDLVGDDRDDAWVLRLRVEAAGFSVEDVVTRVRRSSSAGVMPAGELPNGDTLVVDWRLGSAFRVEIRRLRVEATDLDLTGRLLSGTLAGPEADATRTVLATTPNGEVVAEAAVDGHRFALPIPEPAEEPLAGRAWRTGIVGVLDSGERLPVTRRSVAEFESVQTGTRGAHAVERNRVGELGLVDWSAAVYAESVDVAADGTARVAGRVLAPDAQQVTLSIRSKKSHASGGPAAVCAGRFTGEAPLRHRVYRFGEQPLPVAEHDLSCSVLLGASDDPVTVPLLVSRELGGALPVAVRTDRIEGQIIRGPGNGVRLSVGRPLGDAAGKVTQNRLRTGSGRPSTTGDRSGLLIRSYFGECATDSGLGVQRELLRRGADVDIYWAVQDHSVPVPDGVTPVIQNSHEWYRLLGSAKYYLDNMYQPDYHQKPPGQVIVQTFHGYPFKRMGHPHWRQSGFSRQRVESYERRTREWDYVVSPASYATPLLSDAFGYDGTMLEIGYPRNDVFFDLAAPALRTEVRRSLGIRADQTAVLYAPTFRDHLSPDDNRAAMVDFLDLDHAADALGDDYVLLVRGHAFNARTNRRVPSRDGVVDVTDYPDVADLCLAADVAVLDYSSLRFDFAITGKPMIFQVPDLDHYRETRGWLFDFEPTAPGPHVASTVEIVECLRDLDAVDKEYADTYDDLRRDYLDLDDGHASARLVDAVFVPRGDAPGR